MADMKIRDYLTGRGVNDSDITYNNGNVMLKGKNFMGATPHADGSTYGDQGALNQAFNNYNVNDNLDTFKANLNKPRQQFAYDANSDPLYQNALGAAQRNAQTAGNNASVRLGARGIGNSQQALTTENQIQQRSVADVNSNILPQLMNQAYSRYHDQQVMDDARNGDFLKLAGTYNDLGQQERNNQFQDSQAAEQKKQGNWDAYLQSVALTGDMGSGAKDDYSLLGGNSGNLSMQGQQMKDNQTQQGIENKFKKQQMEQSAQQFAASQGLQWANLSQRDKEFVADQAMKQKQIDAQNSPNNLDNKYKQAQIDSLTNKNAQTADHGIDEYDLSMIDTLAANKGVDISKPGAIKPFIAELKTQYGWTTEEAKQVESYLTSKVDTSAQGSSSLGGFLPSFNTDSIKNNLQGGLGSFNGLLNKLPGSGGGQESSPGYVDYLKELAKKSNPLNLFK